MNFQETKNKRSKLNKFLPEISEEIVSYSNLSRSDIFNECLSNKLSANLSQYFSFLNLNSRHLSIKPNRRVLKAVTKLQKNSDKDYLKSHSNIENNTEKREGADQ